MVYNFSTARSFTSSPSLRRSIDSLVSLVSRLLLYLLPESTSMPDSENFLNQTFAAEQFVALTLLRRGGPRRAAPRRARARLLRPSAAPLGRGYGSRLNPINPRASGEERKEKETKRGQTSAPVFHGINRLARESSSRLFASCSNFVMKRKKNSTRYYYVRGYY